MWLVYFGVVLAGIGLMAGSIARNLRESGRPPPASGGALPPRASLRLCLADLELLYRDQNLRAWTLAGELEAKDPLGAWNAWSRQWEGRVGDLGDRCRLDQGSGEDAAARAELAAARDALLALHRAYAAQVNRFRQEHGELLQAAAEALAHAREAVANAKAPP
jgi:hypothetical protein